MQDRPSDPEGFARYREGPELRYRLLPQRIASLRLRAGGGVQGGNIPVYFHVIQDSNGAGNISDSVIAQQIAVMNAAFNFTAIGAGESWTFTLAQTTHTLNAQWYRATPGSAAETAMKTSLRVGTADDLNIYTGINNGSLLGWATFPNNQSKTNKKDGVVIANDSVPGGQAPYDEGDTAVHEVGHWMGLYHTFQGGCSNTGDQVADTPAEQSPAFGCPIGRNSCIFLRGQRPDPQLHGLLGRRVHVRVHAVAGRPDGHAVLAVPVEQVSVPELERAPFGRPFAFGWKR